MDRSFRLSVFLRPREQGASSLAAFDINMHVEKCGQREFCSLVALGARICLNGPLARCMAGRAASVGRRGHLVFGRASICLMVDLGSPSQPSGMPSMKTLRRYLQTCDSVTSDAVPSF